MIDTCTRSFSLAFKNFYMVVLMAEDKSRYNDMNTILYEMDAIASHNLSGYHSNSLIVHCFIHFRYHLKPKNRCIGP